MKSRCGPKIDLDPSVTERDIRKYVRGIPAVVRCWDHRQSTQLVELRRFVKFQLTILPQTPRTLESSVTFRVFLIVLKF